MHLENLLFYFFSSVSVFCGLMVIGSKNPIHSILSLILVFCNVAGLFILLEVEFLAMIFLVVYVGAIAILFLFVVMMLNIKLVELEQNLIRYLPVGGLIGLVFLVEIFLVLVKNLMPAPHSTEPTSQLTNWISEVENVTNIEAIGEVLYTHYFYLFLVASMILLVSMIGAIVLTLHHREAKRQDIYKQVARDLQDPIILNS